MSNTKSRPMREAIQIYRNRDYVLSMLDESTFDLMNTGDGGSFLSCSGCLDALNEIPAGSTKSAAGGYYDASFITRGRSAAAQASIDAYMMNIVEEIIANKE